MKQNILILFIITSIACLASCSTKTYVRNGSKISLNKNTPKYPDAYIDFKSRKFLLDEINKKAINQMWDSARKAKEISLVPKGGYIILTTASLTRDAAKADNFEILVTDSAGNKIFRKQGESTRMPNYSYNRETRTSTWSAVDIFSLKATMNAPFKVYVFNTLLNTKGEFDIYPNVTKK